MKRILLLLLFGMVSCWTTIQAQGTISTFAVYPDNNGSSAVSFEVESTTPIEITDITNVWNAATTTTDVWVRVGGVGVATSPLSVTTANGWVQHQVGATITANGTTPVSIQSLIPISVPSNTPVGIVITGGMRYSGNNTTPPSPTSFTDGPVTLRAGGTVGYGGTVPSLTFNPRGFLGTISYVLGVVGNCTPFTDFKIDSISGTAAKVNWIPGTGNTSFFMEYGVAGFTPGSGTSVSGTYPGSQPPVILSSLSPQTTYDVYFGEICNSGVDSVYFPTPQQFTTTKSCAPPTNFTVSNVGSFSADFSWNSAGSVSSFNIIYDTTGFDPAVSGNVLNVTSSPATLTNLSGNTVYDVYIYSDCGTSGLSDTIGGPISFRTLCAAEPVGYFNGFESDALNSPPLCWTDYRTSTNSTANVISFSGPNTGTNHLRITNSTASSATNDTLGIISPELTNLSTGLNQIRFFAQTDDVAEQLIVGTVPHPDSIQQFTPIDTISFNATFDYQEYIVAITIANGYNGTDAYVAFVHSMNATFNGLYIDDFNYEAIPPCPKITGISVVSVSDTSVNLDFSSSGNAVGYEWGPTGFTQGTGTNDTIKSGSPITITGLGPNSTYDIYLRNDCRDSANGQSIWTGPITFTTNCAALIAPVMESFDNTTLPSCWSQSATSGGPWLFQGSNNSVFCAAATDHTGNNGNYTWMDQSGTDGLVSLISPVVDVSALTVPYLEFYYWMCGAGYTPPNFTYIEAWDGANWVNVDTLDYGTNGWEKTGYDLTSYVYNSSFVQIRFTAESGGSTADFYGDNALDDIFIFEKPSCNAPVNLTFLSRSTNSISFGWDSDTLAQGTNIQYGATGFTLGSGFMQSTTDSLDTIMNLNSNTTYDIYIQDSCGAANGNSIWIGPLTVTTKCVISPTSLPFFEGFENIAVGPYAGDNDFCEPTYIWEFEPQGANGRLRVSAGPVFVKTGLQAATLDQSLFSSRTSNFLTLNVDLSNYTTANGIELGFSVLAIAQEADDDNRVWARGSQSDPWIEIVNLDNVTTNGSFVDITNIDIVAPLAAASQTVSSTTQIRFGQSGVTNAFNASFSDGYSFDDVSLTQVTCPTPTGLAANSILDTSVTLGWNAGTGANSYEVWFGPVGFFQGTQTNGGFMDTLSTNSLLIDTLSSNTCYEFLIRAICGPGDSSVWVGPIQFCTPCSSFLAPYSESFDNTTLPTCWSQSATLGGPWLFQFTNNSVNCPAATDHTGNGGNYAWMDQSGTDGLVSMSTPVVDVSALTTPYLEFYYWMCGVGYTPINITYVEAYNGTGWTPIDTLDQATSGWEKQGYDLTSYTYGGSLVQIRFTAESGGAGSDFFGDNAIDDVLIADPITCTKPINLSASNIGTIGATLHWDSDSGTVNGNYVVSYGAGITDPANGTVVSVNGADSLILASGLTPSSSNCFFVAEVCTPGDTSFFSGPFCFNTLCLPFTAPFVETFDNTVLPTCWSQSATSGGPWLFQGSNNSVNCAAATDHTGNGGGYTWMDQSGADGLVSLITPEVDISALANPSLEFYYWMCGVGYTPINRTYIDAWDGAAWVNVDTLDSATTGWELQVYDLSTYTYNTSFVQIRFTAESGGSGSDFFGDNALDDVSIINGTSCASPTGLDTANVVCNNADLIWISDTGTVSSSVEYGVAGFTPGTGTVIGNAVSPQNVILTGGTTYEFYVTDTCTSDTSNPAGPFTFTTPVCPSCVDPILDTANVGCSSADLVWISGATTISSALEWGVSGFTPGGGGTIIAPATSPISLTGLTPGVTYDFYVLDFCANDTSNLVSFSFTTASGPISASFTQAVDTTTTTYQTISFDASGSSGATSYSWNFGDGTTGSGMTTSNQYTIDSTWTVTLIVTGDCGSDTITQTVTTSGISIEETPLARTLQLYPNPTRTMLNISFDAQSAGQATFSILDLSGRVVMEVVESNVYDKYQGTLDISHLANGTYMLEIESAGVTVKRRVIKQ